jgi:hypothetical protein
MSKVLTAPLAVIKVQGITVGLMKNIRCTETMRRGRVSGIGELTASELPALEWNGTLSCQFYTIKFDETGIPNALKRKAPSLQAFIDNVLLQEDGVDITIFKKVKDAVDPTTGLISSDLEEYATISGCFVDRESFDVSEGQISGQDQDFTYITPIIYSL